MTATYADAVTVAEAKLRGEHPQWDDDEPVEEEELSPTSTPVFIPHVVMSMSPYGEYLPTVWFNQIMMPPSAMAVLSDPNLFGVICDYCKTFANLTGDKHIEQVLCGSCRIRCSEVYPCTGVYGNQCRSKDCDGRHGGAACTSLRFVNPLGEFAPMCRCCYHVEEMNKRNNLKFQRQQRHQQRHHHNKKK